MTADRTAATDQQFADLLARVEAAEEAEESLRMRLAAAFADIRLGIGGYERLADAALAVIRTPADTGDQR